MAGSSATKDKGKVSARDAITKLESSLQAIGDLLPKSKPGGPKLRSPYTVSEAVTLDEIEKKANAKASSVRGIVLNNLFDRSRVRAR
jgi:hypothetical protein